MAKSLNQTEQHAVERAALDLRRGVPVILVAGGKRLLVASAEEYSGKAKRAKTALLITAARAKFLLSDANIKQPVTLPLDQTLLKRIDDLTGKTLGKPEAAWVKKHLKQSRAASSLERAALTLLRIAELMPAAIVSEAPKGKHDLLTVKLASVEAYEQAVAYALKPVSEAPLTLSCAEHAKLIAFRPGFGGKEHYAIIVGKPNLKKTPIVRIHSSCYTGDLLGSLKCDCRDQLHAAIHFMEENGGGIVLYLMQEGRGIGLVNKLRAYALQARELDTVDANEFLGFDDDERPFLPAAIMLKHLGVKSIRLMTNNPRKVKGIEQYGIKVRERVNHEMERHEHNHAYLETKFSRLGHVRK